MKDIKEIYGGAATYKSTSTNTLLNFLELPKMCEKPTPLGVGWIAQR